MQQRLKTYRPAPAGPREAANQLVWPLCPGATQHQELLKLGPFRWGPEIHSAPLLPSGLLPLTAPQSLSIPRFPPSCPFLPQNTAQRSWAPGPLRVNPARPRTAAGKVASVPPECLPWLCCRCRPGTLTLFQEKVILLRFPACFSQGARDMPSPRTVNKLAAVRGAGCSAWSQGTLGAGQGERCSQRGSQRVLT